MADRAKDEYCLSFIFYVHHAWLIHLLSFSEKTLLLLGSSRFFFLNKLSPYHILTSADTVLRAFFRSETNVYMPVIRLWNQSNQLRTSGHYLSEVSKLTNTCEGTKKVIRGSLPFTPFCHHTWMGVTIHPDFFSFLGLVSNLLAFPCEDK